MPAQNRKVAFMLMNCEHGTFITSRFDVFGGNSVMETGVYEPQETTVVLSLLGLRRQYFGDGVVLLECGAHIGYHTIDWSRQMTGWGSIIAIEAQEPQYYCLCGNIVLNNCFNVRAIHAAVGNADGTLDIPKLDYQTVGRFGSVELKPRDNPEYIGQAYGEVRTAVPAMRIDSLKTDRLDLIKLDIEGMEIEAIEGAVETINRHHPILTVETIKIDTGRLGKLLDQLGYKVFQLDRINIAAVHSSDPVANHIKPAAAPGSSGRA